MTELTEHKVSNPANFILAGNATFTLRSAKTGKRFTYKVVHKEANGNYTESWMVLYLFGPDNEGDYAYMGQIRNGAFMLTEASKRGGQDRNGRMRPGLSLQTPVVAAFDWSFPRLMAGRNIPDLEVWHEGRCGRCGRKLTVPESIEMGIGPECASKGMGGF